MKKSKVIKALWVSPENHKQVMILLAHLGLSFNEYFDQYLKAKLKIK